MAGTGWVGDTMHRAFDSDVWHSFKSSKVTIAAAIWTTIALVTALFAPWLSSQNPFDPAALSLMDAFTPPVWHEDGVEQFVRSEAERVTATTLHVELEFVACQGRIG